METIATKFSHTSRVLLEDLRECKAYQLREKLNRKEKLTREEKNWITERVNTNAYFTCAIPVGGWKFDFSDILKTYAVKQYGDWRTLSAIDKTSIRAYFKGVQLIYTI